MSVRKGKKQSGQNLQIQIVFGTWAEIKTRKNDKNKIRQATVPIDNGSGNDDDAFAPSDGIRLFLHPSRENTLL